MAWWSELERHRCLLACRFMAAANGEKCRCVQEPSTGPIVSTSLSFDNLSSDTSPKQSDNIFRVYFISSNPAGSLFMVLLGYDPAAFFHSMIHERPYPVRRSPNQWLWRQLSWHWFRLYLLDRFGRCQALIVIGFSLFGWGRRKRPTYETSSKWTILLSNSWETKRHSWTKRRSY